MKKILIIMPLLLLKLSLFANSNYYTINEKYSTTTNSSIEPSLAGNIHFINLMNLILEASQPIISKYTPSVESDKLAVISNLENIQSQITNEINALMTDFPIIETLDDNARQELFVKSSLLNDVIILAHLPGGPIKTFDDGTGGGTTQLPCAPNMEAYTNCALTAWGAYVAVLAGCSAIIAPPMVVVCMSGASVAYIGQIYTCKANHLCP
jgi:hypothetical protein